VDALDELVKKDVVKLFEKYRVLNSRELHARHEVALETYIKTINVEAQLMVLMANRYVTPSVVRYQRELADSVTAVRAAGGESRESKRLLDRVIKLVDDIRVRTDGLAGALEHHAPSTAKHARYMRDTVVPAMAVLRETVDQIEVLMPHEAWPLPTYREMLFVK
jgi:glutamine synthetase